MLRQLEIIKPNGEVQFYPLDPDKEGFHLGRDPRNDLVIDLPEVRPFHAYLDYRQKPARFTLLDEANSLPGSTSTLQLGGFIFIVLEEPSIPLLPEAGTALESMIPPAQQTLPGSPYYEVGLGELVPKRQALSWSMPSARYTLTVTNRSQAPVTLRLEGADLQRNCRFEYYLPGQPAALTGQVDFSLLPDEQVTIPFHVMPVVKSLAGLGPQVYPFTITVTGIPGQRVPRSILGQLASKPLLGPGMLAMLSFAIIAFSIMLFRPLLEYSQTVTAVVLNPGPQKEKPVILVTFPRPETTPMPPVAERRPDMSYEAMFQEIAPQYGLDWRVLEAVAYHESRMNYLAVGRSNDMGMMQIIPSTWDQWAPKVGVYDPFDPYSNISVGAAYLAYVRDFCIRRGHSEPHWMLIAYNWGPKRVDELFDQGGNWDQVPPPQRHYASSILEMAMTRAANTTTLQKAYSDLPDR